MVCKLTVGRGKILFFLLLCEIPVALSTTVPAGYSCTRAVWVFSAYVWLWLYSVWVTLVPGQGVVDSAHLRGITSGHSGLSHALYCRWDQASVSFCQLHLSISSPLFPFQSSRHSSPSFLLTHISTGGYLGLHWLMDCSLLPNSLGCGPLRHVIWGTSGNASTHSSYCVTCGENTSVINNYLSHAALFASLASIVLFLTKYDFWEMKDD